MIDELTDIVAPAETEDFTVECAYIGERLEFKNGSATSKLVQHLKRLDTEALAIYDGLRGIFTGNVYLCTFTNGGKSMYTKGHKAPKYVRRHEDRSEIALWQATEDNQRGDARRLKEDRANRQSEIKSMLAPVIEAIKKTDRYGKRCLINAVTEILAETAPGKGGW